MFILTYLLGNVYSYILRFALNDILFIGIHIRRSDYVRNLKTHLGEEAKLHDQRFYLKAMQIFKEKFQNKIIIFVIASDQIKWCKKMFQQENNVYFPDYVLNVGHITSSSTMTIS